MNSDQRTRAALDSINLQLECETKKRELDELLKVREVPIEDVYKYGKDFFAITEEDRGEIEGILGVVDRSELLLCELSEDYSAVEAAFNEQKWEQPKELA